MPILALFAVPHDPNDLGIPADDEKRRAAYEAWDMAHETGPQVDAFEKGLPTARVVRIPYASHDIVASNESEVLREMNAFIGRLPR